MILYSYTNDLWKKSKQDTFAIIHGKLLVVLFGAQKEISVVANTKRLIIALIALFAGLMLVWCLSRDSPDGAAQIFDAARQGDLDKVKSLLAERPELVNAKNKGGYTPLHRAAEWKHKDIVGFLLAKGAEVNAKTYRRCHTPLHIAAGVGCREAVEVLLANGADVNAANSGGLTALHVAAFHEYRQIVSLLIARGAKVNAKTGKRRFTALHIAASEGCKGVAEVLLANGAELNPKNYSGHTPLDRAVCRHHEDVAQILREYGGVELYRPQTAERESGSGPKQ